MHPEQSVSVHVHACIGRNASCTMSDWLTSRPGGCLQPRELWFTDILMHVHVCLTCSSLRLPVLLAHTSHQRRGLAHFVVLEQSLRHCSGRHVTSEHMALVLIGHLVTSNIPKVPIVSKIRIYMLLCNCINQPLGAFNSYYNFKFLD